MLIDKLACRLPSQNAFYELVYPPKAPHHKGEGFKLVIRNSLDMGNAMPPTMLNVCSNEGRLVCKAHNLLFQGHILVYDPVHDMAV